MPEPLNRLELLERELDALVDDDCYPMSLSRLDGFVAGIVVCPERIEASEWMPMVWGAPPDDPTRVFDDEAQAERLVRLVLEHCNATAALLNQRPEAYEPIINVEEPSGEIMWEIWIDGFETAMRLRPDAWMPLADTAVEASYALNILVTLADINRGVVDPQVKAEALSKEAPALIPRLVRLVHAWRRALWEPGAPARRAAKPGRNDPCLCGSGKKYKRCCGVN
ncbi:MAG: UPF0149 family protein [Phreatobacter sp.]